MKFTRMMTGNSVKKRIKGLGFFIIISLSSYNKHSRHTRIKEEVNPFKLNDIQITEY